MILFNVDEFVANQIGIFLHFERALAAGIAQFVLRFGSLLSIFVVLNFGFFEF